MMNLDIIKEIKSTNSIKRIERCCNAILKKLSYKSANDLRNITELMVLLYIFDRYDDAIEVGHLLDSLEFTGDYTIWEEAVSAMAIAAVLLKQNGEEKKANEYIEKVISQKSKHLFPNNSWSLVHYDEQAQCALETGSKSGYAGWLLVKMQQMFQYLVTPDFPIPSEILKKDIEELKEELRIIIK